MNRYTREGWDAAMAGLEDCECPYHANSLATAQIRSDWLRGWDAAKERLSRGRSERV